MWRVPKDAIAERADVARGTFFNYFQRKDDLVTQWVAQRRDRLRAALELEAPGEPDGVTRLLRSSVRLPATMNEQAGRAAIVMIRAHVETGQPVIEEPYAAHLFARLVALGQQRGEFDPAADAEQCGHLLRDAYFGVLYRWSRNGGGPLAGELNAIFELVLCGLLVRTEDH